MFNRLICAAAIMIFISACQIRDRASDQKSVNHGDSIKAVHETMPDSLNPSGIYQGKLPCADCAGIAIEVDLRSDKTYVLSKEYLGKNTEPFVEQGLFRWDGENSLITLEADGVETQYFKLKEDDLIMLDKQGKEITGQLADLYRLKKTETD